MVARAVRGIALAAALGAAFALGSAASDAERPAPTALERRLQPRLLDRYFLLRADVKIQRQETRAVISNTYPPRRAEQRSKSITTVTPEGVFYVSDYADKGQFVQEARAGVQVNSQDKPGLKIEPGGNPTTGDILEVERDSLVAIRAGDLARVTGVQEVPEGVRLSVEGMASDPVDVMLREVPGGEQEPAARERALLSILGHLVHLVPDTPTERAALIDPAWATAQQEAIRSGRVIAGMSPYQVLLTWGAPLHVSRDPGGRVDTWLFRPGSTVAEQMRRRVDVYFAAGAVTEVVETSR
jgi:hypothetical protein